MHSESIHLVSQRPKIDGLYAVISAATCPDFSALYLVLSFYVPNNVVVLGVRRGVGMVASFGLSLRRVIRVPEQTYIPSSQDRCDLVRVSYGFFNLFKFTWWVICPPSSTRAPMARRSRGLRRPLGLS